MGSEMCIRDRLKPQTDVGAQIVVRGKVQRNATAREYYTLKDELLPIAIESFETLKAGCDIVIVEGAGSPAEVNLRHADIANMGFAVPTATPVILVGDIERGGVIANMIGTYHLHDSEARALLSGYIINKFRCDVTLFDDGLTRITQETGICSFGILPWFEAARRLPAEDALGLSRYASKSAGNVSIAVPIFSRGSNFDDLDPLAAEPDVDLVMVQPGEPIPAGADLILLTGSKATRTDLAFLYDQGWDIDIQAHVRRGGAVLGLCAGYQMLGHSVADPAGVEGTAGKTKGLALLDMETVLGGDKTLSSVEGRDLASDLPISGYEMHIGETDGPALANPMLRLSNRNDGAVSSDGLVSGCYVHGLFTSDQFRSAFLGKLKDGTFGSARYETMVEKTLDDLAEHCAQHLDLEAIGSAAGLN